jgi:hypothetical protein
MQLLLGRLTRGSTLVASSAELADWPGCRSPGPETVRVDAAAPLPPGEGTRSRNIVG